MEPRDDQDGIGNVGAGLALSTDRDGPASTATSEEAGMHHGPTRCELWFRLLFSLAGLGLLVVALLLHGFGGIAWNEVVLIATAFFAGSAVWSAWQLIRHRPKGKD